MSNASLSLLLVIVPSAFLPQQAPAQARGVAATATIEWSYRPRSRLAVDGILWRCAESACTAPIGDGPAAAQRACYRLAARFGRVLRFETQAGPLSEEELARCNRSR